MLNIASIRYDEGSRGKQVYLIQQIPETPFCVHGHKSVNCTNFAAWIFVINQKLYANNSKHNEQICMNAFDASFCKL